MDNTASDSAALMVLRLWTEPGAGIRVRATSSTDAESDRSTTAYVSRGPEVVALVQAWLDHVTDSDGR